MEKWKFVDGSTKYQVSDLGRFRNSLTGHVVKPGIDKYGYPRISYKRDDGLVKYRTIHRLVAESFVSGRKADYQVNHINGVKTDNRVTNLEWVSASKNIAHSYETGLNKNKNGVKVTDLETSVVTEYRSIKDVGKNIDIHVSTLVPLIRNSKRNPIFGKYVIELIDEDMIYSTANTANFGRQVYVLDTVTDKIWKYPSFLIASYFTGIRSISNIARWPELKYILGYYISLSPWTLPNVPDLKIDKESVMRERQEYLDTPYIKRDPYYELYNYRTKEVSRFASAEQVAMFVNGYIGKLEYCTKDVTTKLSSTSKLGKTGLIHGFGLRSDVVDFDWFPYSEEVLISSELRLPAPNRVYRVFKGGCEKIVVGDKELHDYLGLTFSKKYCELKTIVNRLGDPNIRIERLNKPLL